jgi:hypothetical protein
MSDEIYRDAPRKVHGCTIKNDSQSKVKVRVLYEEVSDEEDNVHRIIAQTEIPIDGTMRVDERSIKKNSNKIIQTIDSIQVTRENGHKQELKAPFEGVVNPEKDWLFVINNAEIQSVQRND